MATPPLTPQEVVYYEANSRNKPYWYRAARSLDKFVNALTGGNEDETISDRVWRVSIAHPNYRGWNPAIYLAKGLNAGLDFLQAKHGAKAAAGSLAEAEVTEKDESTALDFPEEGL